MATYYRGFKVPSAEANSKKETQSNKDNVPRLYRGAEYQVDQLSKSGKSSSGIYRGVSWGR